MCDSTKYFVSEEEKKKFRNILKKMDLIRNYKCSKPYKDYSNLVEQFDEAFPPKKTVMLPLLGWAIINNDTGEVVKHNIEHHHSFSASHPSTELKNECVNLILKGINCRIEKIIIKQYKD